MYRGRGAGRSGSDEFNESDGLDIVFSWEGGRLASEGFDGNWQLEFRNDRRKFPPQGSQLRMNQRPPSPNVRGNNAIQMAHTNGP